MAFSIFSPTQSWDELEREQSWQYQWTGGENLNVLFAATGWDVYESAFLDDFLEGNADFVGLLRTENQNYIEIASSAMLG